MISVWCCFDRCWSAAKKPMLESRIHVSSATKHLLVRIIWKRTCASTPDWSLINAKYGNSVIYMKCTSDWCQITRTGFHKAIQWQSYIKSTSDWWLFDAGFVTGLLCGARSRYFIQYSTLFQFGEVYLYNIPAESHADSCCVWWTSDQRTWCQYDVVLTLVRTLWCMKRIYKRRLKRKFPTSRNRNIRQLFMMDHMTLLYYW